MFKTFKIEDMFANVETVQKQYFDNVEKIVGTLYGISTDNVKLARDLIIKANETVKNTVKS